MGVSELSKMDGTPGADAGVGGGGSPGSTSGAVGVGDGLGVGSEAGGCGATSMARADGGFGVWVEFASVLYCRAFG